MELLERVFGNPSSSYQDYDTGKTEVASYLSTKPCELRAKRMAVQSGLAELKALGFKTGVAKVAVTYVPHRDWAEAWKRHFKPIEVGRSLLIRPSWIRGKRRNRQKVIVLDPGLSFGTGQHPTTLFCLQQIAAFRDESKAQSFLDLGTGSGILALAAARLGYSPILGSDYDPESIRTARGNARINRLRNRIVFRLENLTQLPLRPAKKRYSLICANLLSPLLIDLRQRVLNFLAPGGLLVLAGILRQEFHTIQAAYEGAGLQLVRSLAKGEWQSGAWTRKEELKG
jgi:ribosomal protein L11 methyltransferase